MNKLLCRVVSIFEIHEMQRQFRSVLLLLLVLFWPKLVLGTMLFDWNQAGSSGQSWAGWTWMTNVDGYGDPGWKRNDAVDYGGGGDWRPRSFVKSDCGSGTVASIDTNMRAPSTTSGGSLKLTNSSSTNQVCWWGFIGQDTFYQLGYTDNATNRFSYYAQYHGMSDPGLRTSSPDNYNVEVGTYLFPDGNMAQGNEIGHWYHQMAVVNDVWLHVVLDRHPQHERGGNGAPPNDPRAPTYPYYHYFSSFYWDIPYSPGGPTTVWFDEVQFWTQTQPENDISISTVWVGYRSTDNRWLLFFDDSSWGSTSSSYGNNSIGTYEVRWSTAPITNTNWSFATPINPIYNAASGAGSGLGRIRRPDSWRQVAYTEFQLPTGTEQVNNTLYFAIKDVSSTSFGDGHNSPSANVKTIDYSLKYSSSTTSQLSPPTNLTVVSP